MNGIINDIKNSKGQLIWLLPIFILIAIMPLIVVLDSTPQVVSDNNILIPAYDFFISGKSKLIILLGPACLVCSYFCKYLTGKNIARLAHEPVFLALLAYFILVALSAAFSEFKDISIYGIQERNEGLLVILCYFCFWLTVFFQVRQELHLKFLLGCFYFYIFISFIIGFSQFVDNNILVWDVLTPIIVPAELRDLFAGFGRGTEAHRIFLTLYNQNYVGSMMSIALLVCMSAYFLTSDIKLKILHFIFAGFSFFMLIGSTSRGGYAASFIGVVFLLVVCHKIILRQWKATSVMLVGFALIFFLMNMYLDNTFINRLDTIFGMIKKPIVTVMAEEVNVSDNTAEAAKLLEASVTEKESAPETATKENQNPSQVKISPTLLITDFKFSANEIKVISPNATFFIKVETDRLVLLGEDNGILEYEKIEGNPVYYITTPGYSGVYMAWDTRQLVILGANRLYFEYADNAFNLLNYAEQRIDNPNPPVFAPFVGRELMMSSRGYVWGLSIPMIKDTLILGYGPDSFSMYFPQYDLAGKTKYLMNPTIIVDKPHNMFIQTAINTGVISLIALLAAYAFYFIRLFKLIMEKGLENKWVLYSACTASAMITYLVSGMVNDSVIFVSPAFWVLFGVGCAMNRNATENIAYGNSI